MAPAPASELDDLGLGEEEFEFLISVKSFLIAWYCVEVADARHVLVSVSCEREYAVGGGIGHPVKVAVEGLQR